MTLGVPSWLNKGQPRSTWPDWLTALAPTKVEPNGSFMIRGCHGQLRVHAGWIVFMYRDHAYSCAPTEARQQIARMQDEDAIRDNATLPPPPKPGIKLEAEVADRRDDTDDISAAIAIQKAAAPSLPRAAPSPAPTTTAPAPLLLRNGSTKPARGSMPSIEWVQLDRLKVDDTYQRSIDTGPSRSLIAKIGREWGWRLCVPLMVSRRHDGLYVIDGQHRLFGARQRTDIPQLPCCISAYDGPADEAAMFVAANRERRAMNRLDDFHAAQAGGDADAVAIAEIVTSVGFTVARKTGSASWVPGEVAFTSAIAAVRRKHGDGIVRAALQMMADAFPDQRLTAGSSVFTAICRVMISPPDGFDRDRLFRALLKFDMPAWASFLQGAKGGDDRAAKLRDILLVAYDEVGAEVAA